MKDQLIIILEAMRRLQAVLADIEPGQRDNKAAVRRLREILDDQKVIRAIERLDPHSPRVVPAGSDYFGKRFPSRSKH
jgi:hypothetical protein